MSETPCCDWINRLTLPGKREEKKKGDKGKGTGLMEEQKVKPSVSLLSPLWASLFSFDQDKNLGDCRAQIKGRKTLNNLNATNLDSSG